MSESGDARETTPGMAGMFVSAEEFHHYVKNVAEVDTALDYRASYDLIQGKADELFNKDPLAQQAIVVLPREGSNVKIVDGVTHTETLLTGPIFGFVTGFCPVVSKEIPPDTDGPVSIGLALKILPLKSQEGHEESGTFIKVPVADIKVWDFAPERQPLKMDMYDFYAVNNGIDTINKNVGLSKTQRVLAINNLVDRIAANSPFVDKAMQLWLKSSAITISANNLAIVRSLAVDASSVEWSSHPEVHPADPQKAYSVKLVGYDWLWEDAWRANKDPQVATMYGIFETEDPDLAANLGSKTIAIDLRYIKFGQYTEPSAPLTEEHNVFAHEKTILQQINQWLMKGGVTRHEWETLRAHYNERLNNLNHTRSLGAQVAIQVDAQKHLKSTSYDGSKILLSVAGKRVITGCVEGISIEREKNGLPETMILLNVEDDPAFIAQEVIYIEVPISSIAKSQMLLNPSSN